MFCPLWHTLHLIKIYRRNLILGDQSLVPGKISFNYQHPVVLREQTHHFHALSIAFRWTSKDIQMRTVAKSGGTDGKTLQTLHRNALWCITLHSLRFSEIPQTAKIVFFNSYGQLIQWQNIQIDFSARWQLISLPKNHLQRVQFHCSHSFEALWCEVLKENSFKKSTGFKSKLCQFSVSVHMEKMSNSPQLQRRW